MRHATSRELFAYWNRIRGSDAAPRRTDIEPGDIRRVLPDTFILEVIAAGNQRVRLAGTRMCSLYGREIKGGNFLDLWSPEHRITVAGAAERVVEDATGVVLEAELVSMRGRSVSCEFLLLPLRHGVGTHDRILGSCAVHRRPYWFGTDPIARQSVGAVQLIGPGRHPAASDGNRFVTLPPSFLLAGGRRHGHLYVVDGGKS